MPQQVADGALSPAAIRSYLRQAEELGFTGARTQEQVFGTVPHLSPAEILSFAAAWHRAAAAGLRGLRQQMERLAAEVVPELS